MENQPGNNPDKNKDAGFKAFVTKRMVIAAILIAAVVWLLGFGLNSSGPVDKQIGKNGLPQTPAAGENADGHVPQSAQDQFDAGLTAQQPSENQRGAVAAADSGHATDATATADAKGAHSAMVDEQPHVPARKGAAPLPDSRAATADPSNETAIEHAQPTEPQPHAAAPQVQQNVRPKGVAFVEAVIQPMDNELNKRFWGWRPNDILNFTDNINNFQLGVLEVTRRSVVMLTERISRTGSTDAFNQHLEDAANWLMITATRYWFPSPESKYKECIKELESYKQELIQGRASFFIRTDNLIPLLAYYEDLLGSCDENLVKIKNEDGSPVNIFKADNYFFYAKGVASAMATILEAIHSDFLPTLENRHGTELLLHALESCRKAAALSPLLITDADLDGIFANHRANMAAPISHARFYIGQLIKTLST